MRAFPDGNAVINARKLDADQIASLHEGVDDEITYHLLLPVAESQIAISASMAALGAGSITPIPDPETIETLEDAIRQEGEAGLNASLEEAQELLRNCGYAELYPKVRRDAIIIYGLLHGMDLFAVNDRLFSEDEETLF